MEAAKRVPLDLDLLPNKSRARYESVYKSFKQWYNEIKVQVINEDLILVYMVKITENSKPTSFWREFSMLKSTIMIYNNIDINYPKVIAYLNKQSAAYRSKQVNIFERSDIDKFLETANDGDYLMMKVVVIIGMAGAFRRHEMCKLTIDNVDAKYGMLFIKILNIETNFERIFAVEDEKNIETYQKYIALRPANTEHRRLFLSYKGGKCTVQPIGVQAMGNIPKKIAEFLELPNPEEYTRRSLRRSSAMILVKAGADMPKATKVAEGYIADSIQNKKEIANRIQEGTVVQQECMPGTSKDINAIESDGRIEAGAVTKVVKLPDSVYWVFNNNCNCNITININTKQN